MSKRPGVIDELFDSTNAIPPQIEGLVIELLDEQRLKDVADEKAHLGLFLSLLQKVVNEEASDGNGNKDPVLIFVEKENARWTITKTSNPQSRLTDKQQKADFEVTVSEIEKQGDKIINSFTWEIKRSPEDPNSGAYPRITFHTTTVTEGTKSHHGTTFIFAPAEEELSIRKLTGDETISNRVAERMNRSLTNRGFFTTSNEEMGTLETYTKGVLIDFSGAKYMIYIQTSEPQQYRTRHNALGRNF